MNVLSLNEFQEFLTKLGKREGVTSETYSAGALSRGGGVSPKRARPRLEQTKGYAMRAFDLAMDGRGVPRRLTPAVTIPHGGVRSGDGRDAASSPQGARELAKMRGRNGETPNRVARPVGPLISLGEVAMPEIGGRWRRPG